MRINEGVSLPVMSLGVKYRVDVHYYLRYPLSITSCLFLARSGNADYVRGWTMAAVLLESEMCFKGVV